MLELSSAKLPHNNVNRPTVQCLVPMPSISSQQDCKVSCRRAGCYEVVKHPAALPIAFANFRDRDNSCNYPKPSFALKPFLPQPEVIRSLSQSPAVVFLAGLLVLGAMRRCPMLWDQKSQNQSENCSEHIRGHQAVATTASSKQRRRKLIRSIVTWQRG